MERLRSYRNFYLITDLCRQICKIITEVQTYVFSVLWEVFVNLDKDNCFVAMYGNTQYRKAKYVFSGSQDSFEFFYPGLALFRYLLRDQKKSFRNLVIIGSESSVWFDLVLNFKRFFAQDGIDLPFANQIVDSAGCESPAVQSEEGTGRIIEATARCTSEDVAGGQCTAW